MLTRSASCPDRETARWTIQKVVTANEQAVHRRLAQNTRVRLTRQPGRPVRSPWAGSSWRGT